MKRLLITGSSGLIGSEIVEYFCRKGWRVYGVDNNQRFEFFGPSGDTRWVQRRLTAMYPHFLHRSIDIRNRADVIASVEEIIPHLIVHAAAQPSHDLAASRAFDDFDVNAGGTVNLLEAARQYASDAVFVYLSTNKVYGDRPNTIDLKELPTRWDYDDPGFAQGIPESFPIDQATHSLFGASKTAADIYVQEYGRYFGIYTCCLRGGCLTGPNHCGVELHGFLSYLIKCNVERSVYKVFGYKGKQVRDNIHSLDVARFVEQFFESPRVGEVYNIGGGRNNSVSILEAFETISQISGQTMKYDYIEANRTGDHICYISDLRKIQKHYPDWNVSKTIESIFVEIYEGWRQRAGLRYSSVFAE